MANLTPEQRTALEQWAADGATLNDIQQRLKAQFDVSLTYLDARLLLLDLQVKLKDKPRDEPKPEEPAAVPMPAPEEAAVPADAATPGGSVSISIDEITLPGSLVSGKVTFSDGKTAGWYLDQSGRLGLRGQEPGYRPPAADVPVFQAELDRVLVQAGF